MMNNYKVRELETISVSHKTIEIDFVGKMRDESGYHVDNFSNGNRTSLRVSIGQNGNSVPFISFSQHIRIDDFPTILEMAYTAAKQFDERFAPNAFNHTALVAIMRLCGET